MNSITPLDYVHRTFEESLTAKHRFLEEHAVHLVKAAEMIGQSIKNGGKVLIFGNGGSAADSQHMAAEMIGRMLIERRPLPAIALTTDTSNLTAVANDYGYSEVFIKQVQGLAKKEDVIVALSTSGNSENVVKAVEAARKIGCRIIALTGGSGGKLKDMADISLNVSLGKNSSRIQETHSFAVHSLVDLLDRYFLE